MAKRKKSVTDIFETKNSLRVPEHTFKPRTPASRRSSKILVFMAFSGTRPPQKPVNRMLETNHQKPDYVNTGI